MNTTEIKVWIRIESPPRRVWQALTTQSEVLAWLATEAEIDPREGGTYRVRSGTPMCSGDHVVRALVPERRLELDWRIEGESTDVRLELAEDDGGTRVSILHRIPAEPQWTHDPAFTSPGGPFLELWAYTGGLLKTYLELGQAKCRLDPEREPSRSIEHTLTIAAPPERVFAALDDPELVKNWNPYASAPSNDRRVGGKYSFGWESETKGTDGPHEIVEYEPGRKITYRWYGTPPTLVSWSVEPEPGSGDATRLRLTHSGFDVDRNLLVGWNLGWGGFLQGIALYLERGRTPDWMGVDA
jgi:uncharacterized protein YndB with AHSA1/START domain